MIDLEGLLDLISDFEYTQSHIIDSGFSIGISNSKDFCSLNSFHRYDEFNSYGVCAELMNTAYKRLKETYPQYQVLRCSGQDTQYFYRSTSLHCFLLVSDTHVFEPNVKREVITAYDKSAFENMILVDPSFAVVKPFSESNYTVKHFFTPGYGAKYINSCIMEREESVPLGISSNDETVCIKFDPSIGEKPFLIDIDKRAKPKKRFGLYSSDIDSYLSNDPSLFAIIDYIRNSPIFICSQPILDFSYGLIK